VTLFYILAVLIVGMLVPSHDPALSDSSTSETAAQSPFVIAATRAGTSALVKLTSYVEEEVVDQRGGGRGKKPRYACSHCDRPISESLAEFTAMRDGSISHKRPSVA
jgi:hypothetical protein